VDEVIKEPLGGAHRDFENTAKSLQAALEKHLKELSEFSKKELLEKRYAKFRQLGAFEEKRSKIG
jgi:acetyl-CoA carboxylase carboxyl transferase subunit alpha